MATTFKASALSNFHSDAYGHWCNRCGNSSVSVSGGSACYYCDLLTPAQRDFLKRKRVNAMCYAGGFEAFEGPVYGAYFVNYRDDSSHALPGEAWDIVERGTLKRVARVHSRHAAMAWASRDTLFNPESA